MKPVPPVQVSALPIRQTAAGVEILLVTTRRALRWILPKGQLRKHAGNAQAAARNARNEAGIVGRISERPIGRYLFWKCRKMSFELVSVEVYPLDVTCQLARWRDRGRRERRWLAPEKAARMVLEPGLKKILRSLTTEARVA